MIVALLPFAAPKLPALARSLGQSMRIIRSEVKEMKNDARTIRVLPWGSDPRTPLHPGDVVLNVLPAVTPHAPGADLDGPQPASSAVQTLQVCAYCYLNNSGGGGSLPCWTAGTRSQSLT